MLNLLLVDSQQHYKKKKKKKKERKCEMPLALSCPMDYKLWFTCYKETGSYLNASIRCFFVKSTHS